MPDGSLQEAPLQSIQHMFMNAHTITLWLLPLSLAVLLRLITHRFHHQLIFPLCLSPSFAKYSALLTRLFADFIIIPFLFYLVVAVAGLSLVDLRKHGWLFDLGNNASEEAWYKMYSYLGAFASRLLAISDLGRYRFQRCAYKRYLGDFTYSICIVRVVVETRVF